MRTKALARVYQGLRDLPDHMHGHVLGYVDNGLRPGDFLRSLIIGGDIEAWWRADPKNKPHLAAWRTFWNDCAPAECHGSVEKFEAWIEAGGLLGRAARAAEEEATAATPEAIAKSREEEEDGYLGVPKSARDAALQRAKDGPQTE